MPTRAYARAVMNEIVLDAWQSNRYSKDWPLHFDAVATPPKDTKAGYGCVSIKHNISPQRSIGSTRLFESKGFLIVQVMTHLGVRNAGYNDSTQAIVTQGDGLTASDAICQALIDAARNNPHKDCVTLLNPTAREVGADGSYFITNFVSEFKYDEVST